MGEGDSAWSRKARKKSCSKKKLKRDDDSKKNRHALAALTASLVRPPIVLLVSPCRVEAALYRELFVERLTAGALFCVQQRFPRCSRRFGNPTLTVLSRIQENVTVRPRCCRRLPRRITYTVAAAVCPRTRTAG
jgi:hypothetical protein